MDAIDHTIYWDRKRVRWFLPTEVRSARFAVAYFLLQLWKRTDLFSIERQNAILAGSI